MKKRRFVQVLSTILANIYLVSLFKPGIYRGWFKHLCFPGLNCYSCPLAIAACPLGILQHLFASVRVIPQAAAKATLYAGGTLLLYGLLLGRLVCGWICPFGLLQELLNKVPSRKFRVPFPLRRVKLWAFVIFVAGLPLLVRGVNGYGDVWFCKVICPAGTLEAGLLGLLLIPELRTLVGSLFFFKLGVLIATVFASILFHRPFCKVLCPLGFFYGLFNRYGVFRLNWNEKSCNRCGMCEKLCPMDLRLPGEEFNSPECIRCLVCLKVCPTKAISFGNDLEVER